jgi:hypothetical protein
MAEDTECLFTGAKATRFHQVERDLIHYTSGACGRYVVTSQLERDIEKGSVPEQGLLNCAKRSIEIAGDANKAAAFWVNRTQLDEARVGVADLKNLVPVSFEDAIEELVDHSEKPIVLLEVLAKRLNRGRPFEKITVTEKDRVWARICDSDELEEILRYLHNKGFLWSEQVDYKIELAKDPTGPLMLDSLGRSMSRIVRLTVDGWGQLRERAERNLGNKVFIATKFAWETHDESLRIQVLESIRAACLDCGYEADIVGQNHTGFITDRIIADIKCSRFVVAELTYNNRGVYFEAGLARGLDIPVFHVVHEGHTSGVDQEGKKVHFDVAQIRYLTWKDPVKLRSELRDWIEATVGRHTLT